MPYLTTGKRGFATTVPLVEIVEYILYRLKTGCQWREVPTKALFTGKILTWNAVFYYYNKWSKAGCWKWIWIHMLKSNLLYLDLSGVEFDGSHTAAKNGEIIANIKANPRNAVSAKSEPYQSGTHIFDEQLYKDRSVIEHANAWMDGFKGLLIRFEFSVRNWMGLHIIAFYSFSYEKLTES